MAMNVTSFIGTDNFNMATFNNMISQINDGVNNEIQTLASQLGVQIGSKAQIATGSYTGTETYGASNPNSLTFEFVPKYLIVNGNGCVAIISVLSISYTSSGVVLMGSSGNDYIYARVNGNTVQWYSNQLPNNQMNGATTYWYIAIG